MTVADSEAVSALRRDAGLPIDPARRGPVLLHRIFDVLDLQHFECPDLTCGGLRERLASMGFDVPPLGDPAQPLEGFLFTAGTTGFVFVNADTHNPLGKRRFTVSHEIGHYVLHRDRIGRWRGDETIDVAADDPIEREANRFAAELLMPRAVCEHRADEMRRQARACPRQVLAYRLAAELLVSREAMTYRLRSLGVGDE